MLALKIIGGLIVLLYVLVCLGFYALQEKILFHPEKIPMDYPLGFGQEFEEIKIKVQDDVLLHGLLFKADSSKGLIFYLHGNGGTVRDWGTGAHVYTDLNYDVFYLDYRGYGKSGGEIGGQKQFFEDVQWAYEEMKKRYEEDQIIVLGYSIGTGAAAKTAAANQPQMLILQAPYYSLTDLMKNKYPFLPPFLLKYPFQTHEFLPQCTMPVVLFHGEEDRLIYHGSSVKLQKLFKAGDRLISLAGQGHNGITDNQQYRQELARILSAL